LSNLETTKARDQIRKDGIDKETLETTHMSNSVPPEPKPKPSLFRYSWLASTYRPPELGSAELEILNLFAGEKSQSTYGIHKILKTRARQRGKERSPTYKDVDKRVKRLVQLKLIYQLEEHLGGDKHYRITPYGLITSLDKTVIEDHRHIIYNKDNMVIRSLLLQFFEEETIDSFNSLKEFPTRNIEEYLHDCCSITTEMCRIIWTEFDRYNITDILPPEDIIQKYMSHLDGKPVDENILGEIKEYEKKLMNKLGGSKDKELIEAVDRYNQRSSRGFYKRIASNLNYSEMPPFPLLDIYFNLVWCLSIRLEEKTRLLAFTLVTELGEIADSLDREEEFQMNRDKSVDYMLKDKRFIKLVSTLKKDFDRGYQQFSARLHT
jgi:hypothetical protein